MHNLKFPVSDEAWADFECIWTEVEAKRKTILTEPGQVEKNLYFVTQGVQRVFYLDEKDREATLVFTYPYSFAGVVDSFLLQTESRYYFETLTNSVLLKTSYNQFQKVVQKHSDIESFIRTISHLAMSGLLERMVELQCYSSEEKFSKLLKRSPHILQYVPHKYLANYLGIDATNFSKLINSQRI